MSTPFEIPLAPRPEDIDAMGHVNNIVYVGWIQAVAAAHWLAMATPEERALIAWVVVRHEIDYKAAARLGDALVGRTYVGEHSAATCIRHTEIVRQDGKTLAQARTTWCSVDPGTGRPRRIPETIRASFGNPGIPSRVEG
jgi:acyl-CoA thioester hydrolase